MPVTMPHSTISTKSLKTTIVAILSNAETAREDLFSNQPFTVVVVCIIFDLNFKFSRALSLLTYW